MTFIIRADAQPSDFSLPKLELSNYDLASVLTSGSVVLLTPENLKNGNNLALSTSSPTTFANSAKAIAFDQFAVNIPEAYITAKAENSTYFQLTAQERGVYIQSNSIAAPASAKNLVIKLISDTARAALIKASENYYWDLWLTPTKPPIAKSTGASNWATSTLASDSSTFKTNDPKTIGLLSFNLLNQSQANVEMNIYPAQSGDKQLLDAEYTDASYILNTPKFTASATALGTSENSQGMWFCLLPTILEGGYSGFEFILHSVYIENLTVSGRTANEVAAIRKNHFDSFFAN